MKKNIRVTKRSGAIQDFDIEKIHKVVQWACEGIKDVNTSDIILNAELSIDDGFRTEHIHEVLITASMNCFNEDNPNYQWVAGKLVNLALRKEVWEGTEPPVFYDFIVKNINSGHYDPKILEMYTREEIDELETYITHNRDLNFPYSGIKQLKDKYLVQDRFTKQVFETPQFAYMLIAMVVFHRYKTDRLEYVKNQYDDYSLFRINLPTPQMAGIRTPLRSYASCALFESADTLKSIFATNTAIGYATANRYGIGLNVGKIRAIGASVKNGSVVHTGLIPYIKVWGATVKSCQQNGLRGGGATLNCPWWHKEVEDYLCLKNNGGIEEKRVRFLDYAIGMDKIFLNGVIKDEYLKLYCPYDAPQLNEHFGLSTFEEEYNKLRKSKVPAKEVKARDIMSLVIKERIETGRIYILFNDHANSHGAWTEQVRQSNLCMEILTPIKPLEYLDDPEAEIGICTLSAINPDKIKPSQLEGVCDRVVRSLDEILDIQDYFLPAAERFATRKRSLGIGLINMVGWMARNGVKYTDSDAPNFIANFMERMQYYLIKASVNLAKEKGPAPDFASSKYSQGILPIDTYKKAIDDVVTEPLHMDWEALREEILQHGMRHCTLTAQMPVESSSVISSSTNGVEPPREFISYKKSKASTIPVLVPGFVRYKKNYVLAFDVKDNKIIVNNLAAIVKFLDMSISTNFYYKYSDWEDGILPDSVVLSDIMYAYKMGIPALYYSNQDTQSEHGYSEKVEVALVAPSMPIDEDDCEGGACKL